jgi:ribosomal protein S25
MAENEKVMDYGAFLADLEAKRAVLDAAISSLRAAMSAGAIGISEGTSYVNLAATVVNPSIHNGEIPAGAFLRKSIPEAAKLYLSTVRKKQTTKEIADALLEGGLETNAKDFEVTVGTGLYRVSKKTGEFVRLKDGAWGLAEWYPSTMRVLPEKHATHRGRKAKKAKKTKAKEPKVLLLPEKSESTLSGTEETQKLGDRIARTVNQHPNKEFTKAQIADALGITVQTVAPALARLIKKGVIRTPSPDTYTAVQN